MARAGFGIELIPVPLEQMEAVLQDGRAAAVFPMAVTPERREKLDFSETLLMTGGALYVRAPQPTPASLKALAGSSNACDNQTVFPEVRQKRLTHERQ